MPLRSLQALSTVVQTTSELRPRLNVLTLTLNSTFAVPKCTFHFPQNWSHLGDWWQEDSCVVAICAFNLVRSRTQIIWTLFPQESCCSAFHAAITSFYFSHETCAMKATSCSEILKKIDHVKCQDGVQVSAGSAVRSEDLTAKTHLA